MSTEGQRGCTSFGRSERFVVCGARWSPWTEGKSFPQRGARPQSWSHFWESHRWGLWGAGVTFKARCLLARLGCPGEHRSPDKVPAGHPTLTPACLKGQGTEANIHSLLVSCSGSFWPKVVLLFLHNKKTRALHAEGDRFYGFLVELFVRSLDLRFFSGPWNTGKI